jgi:hypothetical protein
MEELTSSLVQIAGCTSHVLLNDVISTATVRFVTNDRMIVFGGIKKTIEEEVVNYFVGSLQIIGWIDCVTSESG